MKLVDRAACLLEEWKRGSENRFTRPCLHSRRVMTMAFCSHSNRSRLVFLTAVREEREILGSTIHSPMGYPKAKSLLCVQKMANRPALEKFIGRVSKSVNMTTATKTAALLIIMAIRNIQLTWLNNGQIIITANVNKCESLIVYIYLKSSSANAVKMMQGKAKLPTKVFKPLDSTCPIMPHLPLRNLYLNIWKSNN